MVWGSRAAAATDKSSLITFSGFHPVIDIQPPCKTLLAKPIPSTLETNSLFLPSVSCYNAMWSPYLDQSYQEIQSSYWLTEANVGFWPFDQDIKSWELLTLSSWDLIHQYLVHTPQYEMNSGNWQMVKLRTFTIQAHTLLQFNVNTHLLNSFQNKPLIQKHWKWYNHYVMRQIWLELIRSILTRLL